MKRFIVVALAVALIFTASAASALRVFEEGIWYWNGTSYVPLTRGAIAAFVSASTTLATATIAGGYGSAGVSIDANGNLSMDGLFTCVGGAAFDGLTIANTTGAIAGGSGADIVLNTNMFTVDATQGNTVIAGSLAANGGITVDSTALIIADTTGKITGGAAADIDLNSVFTVDATQGNTLTGALHAASATTLDTTLAVAGQSTLTGLQTTGAIQADAAVTVGTTLGVTGAASFGSTVGVTSLTTLNGGLVMDSNKFNVADTTGILTLGGGASIDNNTSATILDLTETTIRASGAFTATGLATLDGGIVCDTDKFAVANATGVITLGGGGTIDNNTSATILDLTETTIRASGAFTATGLATLDGGIVCDTDKFAVANATGVITLGGGATIDNNASASILDLTETTVRASGAFAATGASALDGGITVDTTNFTVDGTTGAVATASSLTADNIVCTNAATFGGGYTAGSGTGATVSTTGAGSFNAALITDLTLTTGINGASGSAGGITVNDGANPGTSPFTVASTGATLITPNAAAIVPLYVDGTLTTTADLLTLKAVDATLNGGLYLECLGGDGTVSVFSVGENGVMTSGYDAAAYTTFTQSDAGGFAINCTSDGTASITLSDAVTCSSTLDVAGAATIDVVGTVAETTNARTCTSADYGKTIFLSCNDVVNVTLPANGAAAGSYIRFIVTTENANNVVIAAASSDTLIAFNDSTADSVQFATGQRIGACVLCISNGTYWVAINQSANNTMTVNT